MMRVLIFGAGGMLGHRVWLHCRDRFDAYAVLHSQLAATPGSELFDPARTLDRLDLADDAALDDAFRWARPDAVINAAGLVKQRPGGQDPATAVVLNALLPHRVAARCRAGGARLVQVSTDCVFSGRVGGYREADLPDPPDVYGRSKLLGEVDSPGMLTLRTSIVGRELAGRQGLLEWFLGQRGGQVEGFTKTRFSGLTTNALAETIGDLLAFRPGMEGVWHVAGEPIDKHAFLLLAGERLGVDVGIRAVDGPAIDRTLDDARFREATGIPKPTWAAMLDAIAANSMLYDRIRGESR